jgi:ribose 5-phosphate isomerase B
MNWVAELRGNRHDRGPIYDDMIVICFGAGVVGPDLAAELVRAFLGAEFDGGDRYRKRLEKIEKLEGMRHG